MKDIDNEAATADYLGVSPRTTQAWRARGSGPRYIRVSASCIRYRKSAVDRWLDGRERTSTSDPGPGSQP